MSSHDCPYCENECFTSEFIEVSADPVVGYNQCTACNKWSKFEGSDGQNAIPDPDTRPEP